jgi:hypothetical protein
MKRDRVLKDLCFNDDRLKSESEEWKEKLREKMYKEDDKWIKRRKKYPR